MRFTKLNLVAGLAILAGAAASATAQPYQIPPDTDYYATRAQSGEGTWVVVRGADWGPPEWLWDDATNTKPFLRVPNEARPEPWYKKVYLLLTYDTSRWDENQVPGRGQLPNLFISDPAQGVTLDHYDVSLGTGQAYWEWTIRPQPGHETITFPGMHGYDMHNAMISMEVGTKCVPQPGAVALLALAGVAAAQRRRR
ncbi:MAG: hypothetical protein DYG92_00080 [Leptolyngbya sp. PLA1]|nr:hypothetical protein [Leptolyngbya sp. PLA1]